MKLLLLLLNAASAATPPHLCTLIYGRNSDVFSLSVAVPRDRGIAERTFVFEGRKYHFVASKNDRFDCVYALALDPLGETTAQQGTTFPTLAVGSVYQGGRFGGTFGAQARCN